MKLSVISQNFKRVKNETHATIVVALLYCNGDGLEGTTKAFKGIAKCCPEDTYDFNIGKKIALARAELKAYNSFYTALNKVIDISEKDIQDLRKLTDKLWNQYMYNRRYINTLVSGSND